MPQPRKGYKVYLRVPCGICSKVCFIVGTERRYILQSIDKYGIFGGELEYVMFCMRMTHEQLPVRA